MRNYWSATNFSVEILSIFFILILSTQLKAYPNFVGYGYTSCVVCHYNTFGNGPLTDYGRAVYASEIAGRFLNSSKTSDEDLANQSGFFGSQKLPFWWRPSVDYRGMLYVQSLNSRPQNRFIHMQADFTNVIRFDEEDRFLVVAGIGYAPQPRLASSSDTLASRNLISREHYVRVGLSEKMRIQAGMQDKIYGLRIVDHTAFSRVHTGLAQNDQAHGLSLHFLGRSFEGGAEYFLGNLFQESDLRQQGASATIEVEASEKILLGTSVLFSKNNYLEQRMGGLHIRWGVGHGSSIISELGTINKRPLSGDQRWEVYGLLQSMYKLFRGFHFITTIEYFTEEIARVSSRQLRFAPGIVYFPLQRVELRIEIQDTRSYDPGVARGDTWNAMGQIHISL